MSRERSAQPKEVLSNFMPYRKHFLNFYTRDGKFRFVVTESAPGTDLATALEIDGDFETYEVTTNLEQDDFFNEVLFRNPKAVYRYAKQVNAGANAA